MEIAKIKRGQLFYEYGFGANIEAVVVADAAKTDEFEGRDQISWTALDTSNGETIDFMVTVGLRAYAPKISETADYVRFKDGKVTIPLHGVPDYDPEDPEQLALRDPAVLLAWFEAVEASGKAIGLADWVKAGAGAEPVPA